jgi:hypothetical protein
LYIWAQRRLVRTTDRVGNLESSTAVKSAHLQPAAVEDKAREPPATTTSPQGLPYEHKADILSRCDPDDGARARGPQGGRFETQRQCAGWLAVRCALWASPARRGWRRNDRNNISNLRECDRTVLKHLRGVTCVVDESSFSMSPHVQTSPFRDSTNVLARLLNRSGKQQGCSSHKFRKYLESC